MYCVSFPLQTPSTTPIVSCYSLSLLFLLQNDLIVQIRYWGLRNSLLSTHLFTDATLRAYLITPDQSTDKPFLPSLRFEPKSLIYLHGMQCSFLSSFSLFMTFNKHTCFFTIKCTLCSLLLTEHKNLDSISQIHHAVKLTHLDIVRW